MTRTQAVLAVTTLCLVLFAQDAQAGLIATDIFNGNVGLSVDAAGSNSSPVGSLQATIPTGATILQAYLYAAGTPYPWYSNSPRTVADYNGAGITLAGTSITNFDTIVGAISDRADIGQWYTGRADVTSLVQSLAGAGPNYSWSYAEGAALNARIDGGVLVIAYEHASLPVGSVALLDGGQDTGGETTTVFLGNPLGDVAAAGFYADMGLAISFSISSSQTSRIDINGTRLSTAAGGFDDGTSGDGGLITAGGIGDSTANPALPFSTSTPDDELYSLVPFLSTGDTSFEIFTSNASNDDNIFFMGLRLDGIISNINSVVPEPSTFALLGLGIAGLVAGCRRRRRR